MIMKKFAALLNVSVKSMLLSSTNARGKSRKKAATGVGAMVLIGLLGLYISGLYSAILMSVLSPIQMESLVFIFMGMFALVGGLLFTAFAVKGVVFGGKDNDLLLSMPRRDCLHRHVAKRHGAQPWVLGQAFDRGPCPPPAGYSPVCGVRRSGGIPVR